MKLAHGQAALVTPPADVEFQMDAARRSFIDFLPFVMIESDDPNHPGVVPFRPWPRQVELAKSLAAGRHVLGLKRRQVGWTWITAAYDYWSAAYHPSSHTGILSKSEDDARAKMRRIHLIHDNLPKKLQGKGKMGLEVCEFANRSQLVSLPSTENAGIGRTYRVIDFDEFGFHPYAEPNYLALRPGVAAAGQMIVGSTANPELGPAGYFYTLCRQALDNELPEFDFHFFGADCRPDQDDGWLEKERRFFVGSDAAFNAFYPMTPQDAFTGKAGLVFPEFDQKIHVRPDPVPWEECEERYMSYDLGGGDDPTVMLFIGVYKNPSKGIRAVHQYGEVIWKDTVPGSAAMYEAAVPWHYPQFDGPTRIQRGNGWIDCVVPDPVGTAAGTAIDLGKLGLPVLDLQHRRSWIWNRHEGFERMSAYLKSEWLTINPECRQSIREFASYRRAARTDPNSKERYTIKTAVDHHGDCMDARRYALIVIHDGMMSRRDVRAPAYSGLKVVK